MEIRGAIFNKRHKGSNCFASGIPLIKLVVWALLTFSALLNSITLAICLDKFLSSKEIKYMTCAVKNCIQLALGICGVSAQGFNYGWEIFGKETAFIDRVQPVFKGSFPEQHSIATARVALTLY